MSPPELIELSPSVYSLFSPIASEEFSIVDSMDTEILRIVLLRSKIESHLMNRVSRS